MISACITYHLPLRGIQAIFLKTEEHIQTPECGEPVILLMSLVSYT